jgi:hypothetical protein
VKGSLSARPETFARDEYKFVMDLSARPFGDE